MDVLVYPGKLSGTIKAPPSKSVAHRAVISACLSDAPTRIMISELSDDIKTTLSCVAAMGAGVEICSDYVIVSPSGPADTSNVEVDFRESASTARFLLPVLPVIFDTVSVKGSGNLPLRPFADIKKCLADKGVVFCGEGFPDMLYGRPSPGDYHISGSVSSQFVSGLLFALPLLSGDSRITVDGDLGSAAYADMTISVLSDFGIRIDKEDHGWFVHGGQHYNSPGEYLVTGDWSNSGYFLAASAMGSDLSVTGLDPHSCQPDRAILTALSSMGCMVSVSEDCIRVISPDKLKAVTIDADPCPDMIPAFCSAACCAQGESRVYNAARLRLKESDRIDALTSMLKSVGISAKSSFDSLTVIGGKVAGGSVDPFNDHRIVMAAAVLSCVSERPLLIKDAESVNKSYPGFFSDFTRLGGRIDVVNDR